MPLDGRGITRSVILLTTGTEHRIGPNGLYVALAREWAASGHIVLRYDLGGIGDSAPPPGEPENVVYPAHALADLQAAIDVASGRAPDQAIVVVGLCSGGYLAFLAAREGLSIDAIVAINPPLFLREGPRGVARLVEDDEIVRYRRSLVDPAKWAKALRGRASYLHAVQAGAAAVGRSVRGALHSLREQPLEGLARDLEIVRGRGCRCRFVFSQGDGGLQYFDLCAPTPPRIEGVPEPIERIVVEGAGHTFRPPAAQRVLRQLLVEVVEQGSGGSSRSSPSRDQAAASR
jgi:hypothetical protein